MPARARKPATRLRPRSACRWSSAGSSPPEEPPVLLPGRTQQRHRLIAERLNRRPFRKLPGSRHSAFEPWIVQRCAHCRSSPTSMPSEEGAGAHRLPRRGRWALLLGPYQLVKKQLEVRLTARTVECSTPISGWPATFAHRTRAGTDTGRAHAQEPSRARRVDATTLIRWAEQTGPNTAGVISHILNGASTQPKATGPAWASCAWEDPWRSALGVGLPSRPQPRCCSYKSLESILRQGLENLPLASSTCPCCRTTTPTCAAPATTLNTRNPTMLPHPTLDKLQTCA